MEARAEQGVREVLSPEHSRDKYRAFPCGHRQKSIMGKGGIFRTESGAQTYVLGRGEERGRIE